jgi:hypothetical protein
MKKNIKNILGSVLIVLGALFIVTNATAIENKLLSVFDEGDFIADEYRVTDRQILSMDGKTVYAITVKPYVPGIETAGQTWLIGKEDFFKYELGSVIDGEDFKNMEKE